MTIGMMLRSAIDEPDSSVLIWWGFNFSRWCFIVPVLVASLGLVRQWKRRRSLRNIATLGLAVAAAGSAFLYYAMVSRYSEAPVVIQLVDRVVGVAALLGVVLAAAPLLPRKR